MQTTLRHFFIARNYARLEFAQKHGHVAEHSLPDIVGTVKIFPALFNFFILIYLW
jgi:hypothetical protein